MDSYQIREEPKERKEAKLTFKQIFDIKKINKSKSKSKN